VNEYGKEKTFEILNINKFNSTRKRMSVVTRLPDGSIELLCKGADNVMLQRLQAGGPETKRLHQKLDDMLKDYSNEGLRTLVLAKRVLTEEEWMRWNQTHHAASTALSDREEALMDAAEEVEVDMEPLGITAIEDKLQEGVPSTIANLARANIKLWVLTGDKMETAENIGFACNLLTDQMNRSYIDGESAPVVAKQVAAAMKGVQHRTSKSAQIQEEALLVDGKALLSIMIALDAVGSVQEQQLMKDFIALAKQCKAVIACRVSPDQKRQIVTMMRKHSGQNPPPMTLSIGDGANDVPMIMEAQVGVGISGNEGMQAVRSSDYAIAQFRYLETLTLVHGRNNYKRISVVVMYSLYKNAFFVRFFPSCCAVLAF
jgi:phospholipid-transporting ATPase